MLISLLASLALAQDPPPPEPVPDPGRQVRILSTGARGGIGSGAVRFTLQDRITSQVDLPAIQALSPVHGWMVRGSWAMSAEDRLLDSTLAIFDAQEPSCGEPSEGTRIRAGSENLLLPGDRRELARQLGLRASPVSLRTCMAGDVAVRLVGPTHASLPTFELERWETRLALTWTLEDGTVVDSIGRPQAEGTRRFAVLRQARQQADLFIDPGRFLDGVSSVRDRDLSLHRPTGLALLEELDPAALVPGSTELAGGPSRLLEEAPDLPWTAANWSAQQDDAPRVPTYLVTTTEQGVSVGIIGVIDPVIATRDPRFADEGVELTPPVPAVREALSAMTAQGRPDLIVVATSAKGAVLDELRTDIHGVDLFLGDRDADVRGLATLDVQLRTDLEGDGHPGVTLPLSGVQLTAAGLQDGRLRSARVVPVPIPLSVQPDPQTLARVTQVRAKVYPPLEDPLLPSPTPTTALTDQELEKAVCEAVLDETDADLALLPDLPEAPPIPGSLTALLVADRLALPDRVEIPRVPGDRYRKLLDQAFGTVPVVCGSPLGERFPRAKGRYLEDERIYTVVTTDRMRTAGALDGILSAARSPLLLDLPGTRPWTDDDGTHRSLRSTAVAALRRLRETHGDELLDELLGRSASDWKSQWLVRVRQLSARIEAYDGVDDEAYSQIPETRATSPSSLTLGTATDVALEYSSTRTIWDLRGRTQFTRLQTAEDVQETADDAKLSTSLTLPSASVQAGPLALRPFAEGLLDSEITPTETDAGVQNPRQADLSLTLGISTPITGPLRAFRVGVLVLQDLAQIDKRAELGARMEAQTRVIFGPRLIWTNQLDGFVYGNTPDQDASDLRFKVFLQSRLGLPLARWLDIAIFGDAFVFSGRVEETRRVSGSFTIGAGIDLGGVFEL